MGDLLKSPCGGAFLLLIVAAVAISIAKAKYGTGEEGGCIKFMGGCLYWTVCIIAIIVAAVTPIPFDAVLLTILSVVAPQILPIFKSGSKDKEED